MPLDESSIAERTDFVRRSHVRGERHGSSFVDSGARGSSVSCASAASVSRDNQTNGVGHSDGNDVVEDILEMLLRWK